MGFLRKFTLGIGFGIGMGPDLDLAVSGIGYLIVAPKVPPRA